MKIFLLEQTHPKLSLEEAKALTNQQPRKTYKHLAFFPTNKQIKDAAYTKKIFHLIKEIPTNKLVHYLKTHSLQQHIKKTYAIRKISFTKKSPSTKQLAEPIWHNLKNPKVNLTNPQTQLTILISPKTSWITKLEYENKENFENRKPHKRPSPHPSSLHPKLARAMINLSQSKTILDPFCGTGGILIEGCILKKKMIGSDISKWMLNKARKNLNYYNCKATLQHKDATKLNKKVEAIVTDIPYGRNTKTQNIKKLLKEFLHTAEPLTKKIIIGLPNTIRLSNILKQTTFKRTFQTTIHLHQTLSKKILVLQQN
ncbi:hypothetical protein CMO92_00180 [Candidatus Woesearchaeota archaeon]|nr:hypothetical protein [Candidatus Woesearchaeota archaeon]|tara:strand:- start:329 stop:1267 length:939 start_codon:yes stop_codon:yes gene_type:complete